MSIKYLIYLFKLKFALWINRYPFKLQLAPRTSLVRFFHNVKNNESAPDILKINQQKQKSKDKTDTLILDLYLVPDGIRNWSMLFFTLLAGSWLVVYLSLSEHHNTSSVEQYKSTSISQTVSYHKKEDGISVEERDKISVSGHMLPIDKSYTEIGIREKTSKSPKKTRASLALIIPFALYIFIYLLIFYLVFRLPLLSRIWGYPFKTYDNWFQRIPQEVVTCATFPMIKLFLYKITRGFLYKKWVRSPPPDQQPLYITKHSGSAQRSFHLLALKSFYKKLSTKGIMGEYTLTFPFLFPVWAGYASLFLALSIDLLVCKQCYYIHVNYLYTGIFIWVLFSILYLFWISRFLYKRKDNELQSQIENIKYFPPPIRYLAYDDNEFYSNVKNDHLYRALNITFGALFVIYIMFLTILETKS